MSHHLRVATLATLSLPFCVPLAALSAQTFTLSHFASSCGNATATVNPTARPIALAVNGSGEAFFLEDDESLSRRSGSGTQVFRTAIGLPALDLAVTGANETWVLLQNRLQRYGNGGTRIADFALSLPTPVAVATNSGGEAWVADQLSVRRVTATGVTQWTTAPGGQCLALGASDLGDSWVLLRTPSTTQPGKLQHLAPTGTLLNSVALDLPPIDVDVATVGNVLAGLAPIAGGGELRLFANNGALLRSIQLPAAPARVAFTGAGDLVVSLPGLGEVRRYTPNGVLACTVQGLSGAALCDASSGDSSFWAASTVVAPGTNLITNGSFEEGPTSCSAQGIMPAPWISMTFSPDTYTFQCATKSGLPPSANNNFTSLSSAKEGLRFAAGAQLGSSIVETLGQVLLLPLDDAKTYTLQGHFAASDRFASAAGYDVMIGASTSGTDGVYVGTIGANAVKGVWTPDELRFTGRDGARVVSFVPRKTSAQLYTAVDALVLAEDTTAGHGTFVSVPAGTPGANGRQGTLRGSGSLRPLTLMQYNLENHIPSAAGVFIIGAQRVMLPIFNNSMLVTTNPIVLLPMSTNSSGAASQSFTWPSGSPAGMRVHAQAFFLDAQAPSGITATQGLIAIGG